MKIVCLLFVFLFSTIEKTYTFKARSFCCPEKLKPTCVDIFLKASFWDGKLKFGHRFKDGVFLQSHANRVICYFHHILIFYIERNFHYFKVFNYVCVHEIMFSVSYLLHAINCYGLERDEYMKTLNSIKIFSVSVNQQDGLQFCFSLHVCWSGIWKNNLNGY
jgi:hypothetical protein